jgi:hypothetical protein
MFHAAGKEEFDKETENEAFRWQPLTITSMTEENDVVIAEGTVLVKKREPDCLTPSSATPSRCEKERSGT